MRKECDGHLSAGRNVVDDAVALRARAMKIDRILTRAYGRKEVGRRRSDPLDTLILTILSQNTNDVNRDRAYRSLRTAYPRWEDVLDSDPKKVAKSIQSGGLANIKSRRIIDVLKFIRGREGRLNLDFLKKMAPSEVDAWLSQMEGVGPKTRAIVMLFSLAMPAFPVDTHVRRTTRRMGLIGAKTTRERAQTELSLLVPGSEYYNFHVNLIEHGRATCLARRPKCSLCAVRSLCDYYGDVFLKGQT